MDMLLLRYVTSFSTGRVRIRHPALKKEKIVAIIQGELAKYSGITSLEFNPISGSVLILYDHKVLKEEQLLTMGSLWAEWLDHAQKNNILPTPELIA